MIPVVASAREFRAWQAQPDTLPITELERRQTVRMIAAIEIARAAPLELVDPIRAETQLRQVHALSTADVALEGLFPGTLQVHTNQRAKSPHRASRHTFEGSRHIQSGVQSAQ
jgi:hypothetical protein